MLMSHNARIQNPGSGGQGIDGGVDADFHQRAAEHGGGVQVREGRGGRRIGQVIGRHVNRLHGGDRTGLGGSNALLEFAHFRRKVGLVAHGGGHAAEQRRNFRARLGKAENVVDEQQHVLAAHVAEVLRHGKARQAHAQARAGGLGHLAVNQGDFGFVGVARHHHAAFLHFQPQVVAFAGAFAHAGEHGNAAVLHGHVVDHLHHDDRLAHARAAEQARLAAFQIRLEQVDHLDPGLKSLQVGVLLLQRRRMPMNGPAFLVKPRDPVYPRVGR